jgi:cell division protein FtsL
MASLFAALTAGGAAGAGAGAAAATGALTITKVLGVVSALASVAGGIAQSKALKTQAQMELVRAEQEKAKGAAEARDLAKEYAELSSEQKVIQLANGLDIGSGTPMNISEATKRQADRNIDMTRENARNRAAIHRLQARALMQEANSAIIGGIAGGISAGLRIVG